MNQNIRTIAFLSVTAVSVGLAALTGWATRPNENVGQHEIGSPFFPEFDDALAATALQVASFDEDAARLAVFKVERHDGLWRIPSHHNYPADAQERLARTATSMIGVERGALVSNSSNDHRRYHVLDPLDESLSGTEGRGDRITLYQDNDELLDLIVGDPVEEQPGFYHVRRADEDQIYRARLGEVDLSANFADWIEQDLLEVASSDLVEMVVNPYHLDTEDQFIGTSLRIVQDEDPILLERKPASSSWVLDGIDETLEQEKVSVINSMSGALAELKIIGVRRKPEVLIALFRGDEDLQIYESDIDTMASRMLRSGFFFDKSNSRFLANEGEVLAGTEDGVRYRLQFGEVFTGTEVEIEVGSAADDADEDDAETTEDGDGELEDESDDPDDSLQRSRYLFVQAFFDETLLGDPPPPPIAPTPPGEEPESETEAGETEAPAGDEPDAADDTGDADTPDDDPQATGTDEPVDEAEASDDESDETDATESDADSDPDSADSDSADSAADDSETPADATDDGDSDDDAATADDDNAPETPTPEEIYQAELAAYEFALTTYEIELAAYEEKVNAAREQADELNKRYLEWYYVISADVYENLKVTRADLVEPVEPPESETTPGLESLLQGLSPGDAPADSPDDNPTPGDSDPESSDDPTPTESESTDSEPSDSDETEPSDSDSPTETPEEADSTDASPADSAEVDESDSP